MFEKLQQIKQLRDQAKQMKDRLATITVSADAMGGKITVIMDGNQELLGIDIDPSLLSPEHKEQVEKEIKNAINDAAKKAKNEMAKQFQQGGFTLPSLGG